MAIVEVKVPQLSESVAEATMLTWHKKVGDSVARDENLIDIETDRRMEAEYGKLEDNILDAVKEQVVGETQLNILHQDTYKYAEQIGQKPADFAAVLGPKARERLNRRRLSPSVRKYGRKT